MGRGDLIGKSRGVSLRLQTCLPFIFSNYYTFEGAQYCTCIKFSKPISSNSGPKSTVTEISFSISVLSRDIWKMTGDEPAAITITQGLIFCTFVFIQFVCQRFFLLQIELIKLMWVFNDFSFNLT